MPHLSTVTIKDVSSEYSAIFAAGNILEGKGLKGDQHGAISDRIAWLNAGAKDGPSKGLGAQITFDLGEKQEVASMRVWNYNESRGDDLSRRGAKDVEVFIDSDSAGQSFRSAGTIRLEKATGQDTYVGKTYDLAQLGLAIKDARLVRFNIKTNHGGDADLIGLSEVQFVRAHPKTPNPAAPEKEAKPVLAALPSPIVTAMRRTLSRDPTAREMDLLSELARARLAHYQANPEAIEKLLAVGESPSDPTLDRAQLAALTDVCITIFNLSETITRK